MDNTLRYQPTGRQQREIEDTMLYFSIAFIIHDYTHSVLCLNVDTLLPGTSSNAWSPVKSRCQDERDGTKTESLFPVWKGSSEFFVLSGVVCRVGVSLWHMQVRGRAETSREINSILRTFVG